MSCEFSIMSLTSGGFTPRLPLGLRPWTSLGDFHPPDLLFRIPFMKILHPPLDTNDITYGYLSYFSVFLQNVLPFN